MNTVKRRTRGLLIVLAVIAMAVVVGLIVSRAPSPATLAAGLQCVENADGDGVDRIEQSLKKSGAEDEALVLRCAWLTRHGRYEEVLRRLPPRLATGPLRRDVLRLVGECLFRVGNLPQAEAALTTLAAEFPDEVAAHRLLAVMYYDLGSNDPALKALSETQRLAPLDYRPHHLAGLILSDSEQFAQAILQLRSALKKHPPASVESGIRRELARALISMREYRQAIDVLAADEESAERSALLAECHWSLGDKSRAVALVDDALNREPDNPPALRIKARLLEDQGQLDEAIVLLQRLLAVQPYDIESRYRFVQLLGLAGLAEERDKEQLEYARYRSLQDRLVELNLKASAEPDAVEARRELVQVCRDLGRRELAEMWQRALIFCEQRRQPPKAEPAIP